VSSQAPRQVSDKLLVTVAICTWNRAALLRETLRQMMLLECDGSFEWELIVVDNNSTDSTPSVLAEFAGKLPLRALHEPKPGKSNAANLVVKEARGEYILWTDDDVLVEPDWVSQYVAAFRRHPAAEVFGGRLDPWFEGTPPRWLKEGFQTVAGVYAAIDLDCPSGVAPESFFPLGASMAIRRSSHLRHAFDPRIGPQPGSSIRGEEWMLVRELRRDGAQVIWVPDAIARHFIPRARQTESYLRDWFYGHGELVAMIEAKPDDKLSFFGRPAWLWRQWVEHSVRARIGRFISPPERWLESLAFSATAWGRLRHYKPETSLR
jgi:glycosyltransferase involved in cell wall biosynthesis